VCSSASKARQVKRGVKEVVKGIRKGEKGRVLYKLVLSLNLTMNTTTCPNSLLVLAADINPIDIISHLPVLSEEAQVPYIFVSSKEELGQASSTKRPTSCVMICPQQKRKTKKTDDTDGTTGTEEDWKELYEECYKEVEKMDVRVVF
jgi:H/ACA ribonucleoprotein complex subunit 2